MHRVLYCLLVLVFLLFLLVPGLFFESFPPAYYAVSFVAKQVGYELHCSGGHGLWMCRFTASAERREKEQRERAEKTRKLHEKIEASLCKSDLDCEAVHGGGCLFRGDFPEIQRVGSGKCVCLQGPVMYGCLPESEAKLWQVKK